LIWVVTGRREGTYEGKAWWMGKVRSAMRDLLTLLGMDSRYEMGQTQADPIIDGGSQGKDVRQNTRIEHEVVTSVLNS
jgi:hypothetical protein